MAEQNSQAGSEARQAGNRPENQTEHVNQAKAVSRWFFIAAGVVGILAIAAGIAGEGTIALWCIPVFFLLGVAANAGKQQARRLTGVASDQSVGRQVAEGILLTVLAFFFAIVVFLIWVWAQLGHMGG